MENNFDLQRLWQTTNEKGDSVSIGAYAGTISLAVFKKGGNKPEIKLNLQISYINQLKSNIKQAITANPGAKIPFVQLVYDPNTKTTGPGVQIIITKTDKKTFALEVSSPTVPVIKFDLKGKGMYSNGSDPMSAEARSRAGLEEILFVLDRQVAIAMMLSKYNLPKFPNRTGNTGPNKQHQTSEGYKKQAATTDPFSGGEDELGDLF